LVSLPDLLIAPYFKKTPWINLTLGDFGGGKMITQLFFFLFLATDIREFVVFQSFVM